MGFLAANASSARRMGVKMGAYKRVEFTSSILAYTTLGGGHTTEREREIEKGMAHTSWNSCTCSPLLAFSTKLSRVSAQREYMTME